MDHKLYVLAIKISRTYYCDYTGVRIKYVLETTSFVTPLPLVKCYFIYSTVITSLNDTLTAREGKTLYLSKTNNDNLQD